MNNMLVGVLVLSGGWWIAQDSICSILYYLKRKDEKWYFNHAVRIIRGLIGIMFIIIGIMEICQ